MTSNPKKTAGEAQVANQVPHRPGIPRDGSYAAHWGIRCFYFTTNDPCSGVSTHVSFQIAYWPAAAPTAALANPTRPPAAPCRPATSVVSNWRSGNSCQSQRGSKRLHSRGSMAKSSLGPRSMETRTRTDYIKGVPHQFIWDEMPAQTIGTEQALVAASGSLHAIDSIPALNSNPGASASLYLDFNGHFEPVWGAYTNITTPAYDIDGDVTTFNDVELANIQAAWEAVAEDYAPFNINVTTVEPSVLAPGMPISAANGVALRVAIGARWATGSTATAGSATSIRSPTRSPTSPTSSQRSAGIRPWLR